MAVYYKFKSARDYDSVPMDGPFISVGALKEKIFESKQLGRGTDFDLLVSNAQTNEEYLDEAMLIPKNASVLIRRVPGRPRMPIVTEEKLKVENEVEDVQPGKSSLLGPDSSSIKYQEDTEFDEFGSDLYAIPEVLPVQSSNLVQEIAPINKADEENKLKALINTPVLDWQRQGADGFGPARGSGRGMNGRIGLRGFGLEWKTPPQGYVCHRCNVPGHFIQHCPTNGDPNYDIKRVKPPTGIPKSMLLATPDGSYALTSGVVATLKPNEAAFEKEIEGLPSTRSIGELPPELHCPLCKEVMKDAVLTSKCCFNSFCDKCIRDHILSKLMCVCGATNVLADDLLPNKTLRDTINRILESGNSSTENAGSAFQVQDMESARGPQPKIPSPTLSSASKGEQQPFLPKTEETQNVNTAAGEVKASSAPPHMSDRGGNLKVPDISEATHESMSMREPTSKGSALVADEEVHQKAASGETAKRKKKKKVGLPANDLQWRTPQDLAAENYMMPVGPSGFTPYWNGMQPGMDGFMGPYSNGIYNMGYGMGPLNMPFGVMPPQDPFAAQAYMNMMPPIPPQRDLSTFGTGMNMSVRPPPIMSREEFEARKADLRRKRENESRGERRDIKDRDYGRGMSSAGDGSFMNSKKLTVNAPAEDTHHYPQRHHRSERASADRSRDSLEPSHCGTKRRSSENQDRERDRGDYDYYDRHHSRSGSGPLKGSSSSDPAKPAPLSSAAAAAALDCKQKTSVFSRISFPENKPTKKQKVSSSSSVKTVSAPAPGTGGRKSSSSQVDCESSDDERHFKRKPSRYESSPPPKPAEGEEEEGWHSCGSRERDHQQDRLSRHSKHR